MVRPDAVPFSSAGCKSFKPGPVLPYCLRLWSVASHCAAVPFEGTWTLHYRRQYRYVLNLHSCSSALSLSAPSVSSLFFPSCSQAASLPPISSITMSSVRTLTSPQTQEPHAMSHCVWYILKIFNLFQSVRLSVCMFGALETGIWLANASTWPRYC